MKRFFTPIPAPSDHAPVTMLELFFDLVFVFIVIQLTSLIAGSPGWTGYGQAALVLSVTWWMYLGYAWLANNVTPTTPSTRLPMLVAMTCFLAMAAVVPDAFGDGAWIFGVSYLSVVTIHFVQFSRSTLGDSARAIRRLAPFNFGASGLLILAALIGDPWGWMCWVAAVALFVGSLAVPAAEGFSLRTGHFAERHRLLIIIALGETIVAVGASSQGHLTEVKVLGVFVLAMVLISALWWVYFAVGDEEAGATALDRVPAARRTTVALIAYSYTHWLHIAGLVLVAVGLHHVVEHPGYALTWGVATTLSAGVAVFLLGQILFRRILDFDGGRLHLAMALATVSGIPLGVHVSGAAQLGFAAMVSLIGATALQVRRSRLGIEDGEMWV